MAKKREWIEIPVYGGILPSSFLYNGRSRITVLSTWGEILPFQGLSQPALEPKINHLEVDKCPRQDLKWINLTVPSQGQTVLGRDIPSLEGLAQGLDNRQARDRDQMASPGLQNVLALEV
jgi:hypothetical protein